jgi:hypothetical protein
MGTGITAQIQVNLFLYLSLYYAEMQTLASYMHPDHMHTSLAISHRFFACYTLPFPRLNVASPPADLSR